jgi:hypothetical protein
MKTVRLISICLAIAAVLAMAGLGHRGYHWFPAFIMFSGFLIGVALLADKAFSAIIEKIRNDKIRN